VGSTAASGRHFERVKLVLLLLWSENKTKLVRNKQCIDTASRQKLSQVKSQTGNAKDYQQPDKIFSLRIGLRTFLSFRIKILSRRSNSRDSLIFSCSLSPKKQQQRDFFCFLHNVSSMWKQALRTSEGKQNYVYQNLPVIITRNKAL
jgi:hypothetical protein